MTEIWKAVIGFEGRYEISSRGRVKSLKRAFLPERILTPQIDKKNKHYYVQFRDGDRRINRYIHQLVAEAFIGARPEGCEVRHLDGMPANNHVSNLAWGTRRENLQDRKWHTMPKLYKLSGDDVIHIKQRLDGAPRGTVAEIAREYGVHHSTIWRINTGKVHSDVI